MKNLQMDVMEAEAGSRDQKQEEIEEKTRLALAVFEEKERKKLEKLGEVENPTFDDV